MIKNPRDLGIAFFLVLFFLLLLRFASHAQGQSLREWFDSLRNKNGVVCCHNFDGMSVADENWRTSKDGYQVQVEGRWIDVPPEAVVDVPNRLGRAHVWLRHDGTVRCFIAGPLS